MSETTPFHPYGPEAVTINLSTGFDDGRLDDSGELALVTEFRHYIYAQVGGAVLSFSRIIIPPGARPNSTDPKNLYIVRNLSSPDASLLVPDGLVRVKQNMLGGRIAMIGGGQLGLPPSLPQRFRFRIGALARNVHFRAEEGDDIRIALHPEDARGIVSPKQRFVLNNGVPVATLASAQGHWLRDDDE